MMKKNIEDLAVFGGRPVFDTPRPISNLARPDLTKFLDYLRVSYEAGIMTGPGPCNALLESRLARFHAVSDCVLFTNGFWALAALMKALGLPGRTEVVIPSLTYRRMADIASWAGLTPHFCDVDPLSMTNTAECVASKITARTSLVLGVHPIHGIADVDGLTALTRQYGLPLGFDSVESVHETHRGLRVGGFGDAEVFSLGASKLINGFEGGYVTTNNPQVARRLRNLNLPSNTVFSDAVTMDARLSEIHAAMALASLDDLAAQIMRNRRRYICYAEQLSGIAGLRLLAFNEDQTPSYKNIMIEVLDTWPLSRDETIRVMNAEMMLSRAYYNQPLHTRDMSYPNVSCSLPCTEEYAKKFILLPCGELVDERDISMIVGLLRLIAANGQAIRARL